MTNELYVKLQRTSVFLHFFDVQFLELKLAHLYKNEVAHEAEIATKIALLCADEILVPAASFFEVGLCRRIILDLRPLFLDGMIWLVGAASNLEEFIFSKLRRYEIKSLQYQAYNSSSLQGLPPFRTRYQSATEDIRIDWMNHLETGRTIPFIAKGTQYMLPIDFETRWERVPENLEERAFIVPYVAPFLLGRDQHPTIVNRLYHVVNEAYFSSYVNELKACTMNDLIYLASPHMVPSIGPRIPFRRIVNQARKVGILKDIIRCSGDSLLALKSDERWIGCMIASIGEQAQEDQPIKRKAGARERDNMEPLRSFIVHGRDDIRYQLKDFLQNSLELPEPVILEQQPSKGSTSIEKFEEYSKKIDVAFVLLTPDDIGGLAEEDQKERARQNVIFELGFFLGHFGRKSGRVILLHSGNLEIPSDLAGIEYIDISKGIEAAGEKMRRSLSILSRMET